MSGSSMFAEALISASIPSARAVTLSIMLSFSSPRARRALWGLGAGASRPHVWHHVVPGVLSGPADDVIQLSARLSEPRILVSLRPVGPASPQRRGRAGWAAPAGFHERITA